MYVWLLAVPVLVLAGILLRMEGASGSAWPIAFGLLLLAWAVAVSLLMEQIVRPLQTLANVIAALREDDYSFRARGGRRNDAMGDLAIEINSLAGMLQARRGNALEAMALVERVITAMPSPVLAFAPDEQLRLLNAAGERAFQIAAKDSLGRRAEELRLQNVLHAAQDELISIQGAQGSSRWIVQRSSFRLRGIPHTLLVLSDVSAALREEERVAWQRLIRVMSHEINNSLTPIKSIAGSLRARLRIEQQQGQGERDVERDLRRDLERGLGVIESRAESLNRFLQAYSELARLPAPRLRPVALERLLERVCRVETRMYVSLQQATPLTLQADSDQLQQALINLQKNAVDAALAIPGESPTARTPEVTVGWHVEVHEVVITITDSGAGIANQANLFVPFYTTKAGGTGIGLVLALQIVEGHGGTIRLRNRGQEQGCAAEVRLPL